MILSLELPITEAKQETPDVKSIKVSLQEKIDFKLGQYMMVYMDNNSKALSIASSPTEDFLLFSTKSSESDFKQRFNSLKVGDKVKMKGPMGIFVLKEEAKEIVFLSGGIGITPFRDMIKYACDKKLSIKMTLIYSNKTPADIVFKEEWPLFEQQNPNLKVVNTITRPDGTDWQGKTGRVDEALIKECCSDLQNTIFYVCGPPALVEALTGLLKSIGVPNGNVESEEFVGY